MSERNTGVTRVELSRNKNIGDGEQLTKVLNELEQCGFIRKYKNFTKEKSGFIYQIIDLFALFCMNCVNDRKINSWINYINTPSYYAWSGNAFEILCLNHIPQIKTVLGIGGVETDIYSWMSRKKENGAHIDLILDRKDGIINICEMKHTINKFVIDSKYEKNLNNKMVLFRQESGTAKALHLTMITSAGLQHNVHSGQVINEITADDLFTDITL